MKKQIINFNQEGKKKIELLAVNLSPEENKKILQELKEFKAELLENDNETIRAEIIEVDYYSMIETLEMLEARRWKFII